MTIPLSAQFDGPVPTMHDFRGPPDLSVATDNDPLLMELLKLFEGTFDPTHPIRRAVVF